MTSLLIIVDSEINSRHNHSSYSNSGDPKPFKAAFYFFCCFHGDEQLHDFDKEKHYLSQKILFEIS